MRHVLHGFLALALLALVGSPALAQRGPGGRGFGGPGMLLQNEGVQKELKLSENQVTQIKESTKKSMEKNREAYTKLRDLPRDERGAKIQEMMKTVNEETMKDLAGIINPDQMKRLKQLTLQQQGGRAFADKEVADALKLSEEQQSKIKTINDESGKAFRELFQGGAQANREEARKKMTELRKSSDEKLTSILNDDQKKAWKDMLGEPFEVKSERRPQ